jgi:hypothetical protein
METTDKRIFGETLISMGELYDRKISPTLAEMYFRDLAEYPLEEVLATFETHRKDPDRGRFFPKIADLMDKLECSSDEAGLVAWVEVRRLMSNSRAAKSADPVAEYVVQELGGWLRLGQTPEEKLVWVEKEFVKRYVMHSERGERLLLGPRTGLRRIGDARKG